MKLNKFSSLFESSNSPVIAVLESAEIMGEDNALVEATLIQADGKFYGIKQDGSIHEAMRKSNRHFKLFAESLKDAPHWLVSESEKYKTDEGDEAAFQAYKDKMMKKHGFTDWEEASKDKDFMNALDRGWNAEDEKGKDGLNEGEDSVTKNIRGIGKVTVDQMSVVLHNVKSYEDAVKVAPAFAKFVDNDRRFKKYEAKKDPDQTPPGGIIISRDGIEEYTLYYDFKTKSLDYDSLYMEERDVEIFAKTGKLPAQ